jgi:YD repeat-containing protein
VSYPARKDGKRRYYGDAARLRADWEAENRPAETDARGNVTRQAYDIRNRVVAITNALNGVALFEYALAGNRTKQTDAAGVVKTGKETQIWPEVI